MDDSKMRDIKISRKTNFAESLIDGDGLLRFLPTDFDASHYPKLIDEKHTLEKELRERSYLEKDIKWFPV